MKPIISPRELAVAIGVSESSLKRWSDEGLIRVSRTAGGHRRIAIGDAIRFVRSAGVPILRPEILGLTDITPGAEALATESPTERFFGFLRDGKSREARGLVLSLYLSGHSIAQIADGPIHGAMEELGRLWKHDPAGVFVEHRATDICVQAVQQLRHLVEPQGPGAVAVGGAPPGDPYLIPSMLVSTALAADAWQAVNLGPDTPFDALLTAVDRHEPRLVWLSISSVRDANELREGVTRVAARLADRGILLVIGGRALGELSLPELASARQAATIAELVQIAGELLSGRPESTEQI